MSSPVTTPIPDVYVLWHPRCEIGEFLARKIHGWLQPGSGLGPQVYYRSLPAPEAPTGGLPPPLPGESRCGQKTTATPRHSNLQIVLPLIDANMIADPAWRHWLSQLSRYSTERREFLPVALDTTAFNAPEALRELNFLRPTGIAAGRALDNPAKDGLARSLLRQVTEALCRLLLGRVAGPPLPPDPTGVRASEAAPPKIKIFLSHAKADGVGPARKIRDYIYSQTQLAAFYDENDIPLGSVFRRVLERDIQGQETAALIAIRSARYASRPWCRREVSLFRRPIPEDGDSNTAVYWRLNPVVVVEAMADGERTLGLSEFGNAPLIRWSDQVPELEEQVVTTLLRDAALAAFHRAVGRTLPLDVEKNHLVLNWLPDPTTVLRILSDRGTNGQDLYVYYPGRGLSGLELDILADFFPTITFCSFEEAMS